MGAAQHHHIGSAASGFNEAWRDLFRDRSVIGRAPLAWASASAARLGAPTSVKRRRRRILIRACVYSLPAVSGVASTETSPVLVREAAGLTAGTVPTMGTEKGSRAAS